MLSLASVSVYLGGRVPTVPKEAGRKIYINMSVWPTQPVKKRFGNNTHERHEMSHLFFLKSNELNLVDSFFKY